MAPRFASLAFATLAAAACGKASDDGTATALSPPPNFELVCDSIDTRQLTTLFCMRHDTRSGEVLRVEVEKLARSQGSTRVSQPGAAGRFQLECEATSSETKGDMYCIRLDTRNGDLLLVSLPKVGVYPDG